VWESRTCSCDPPLPEEPLGTQTTTEFSSSVEKLHNSSLDPGKQFYLKQLSNSRFSLNLKIFEEFYLLGYNAVYSTEN
jgi:hypothetical protein